MPYGNLCFINYAKAFDCVDHDKLWKALREMGIPDHLTCLLRTCVWVRKQQVEPCMGSRSRKEYASAVCCHPVCFTYMLSTSRATSGGWVIGSSRIKKGGRNINNLRYSGDTTPMAESKEELKNVLMRVKEKSEKVGLKLNIQKN